MPEFKRELIIVLIFGKKYNKGGEGRGRERGGGGVIGVYIYRIIERYYIIYYIQ